MSTFLSLLLAGLISGSLYAMTGLSIVATYKVAKVLNFAQGATAALVAYLSWDVLHGFHWSIWLVLVVSVLMGAAFGYLTELVAVRPLARHGVLTPVLATLGISIVIGGVVQQAWGSTPRAYPPLLRGRSVHFLGVAVTRSDLIVLGVAVVAMVVLYTFFDRTIRGTMIRATFQEPEAAEFCGINVRRMASLTWSVAGALTGLAGVLASEQTYLSPSLNESLLVLSLVAVAIGGFQSLPGAVIGGFVVGILESLFAGYVSASYSQVLLLGVLFMLLVIFPGGFFSAFGKRGRAGAGQHLPLLPAVRRSAPLVQTRIGRYGIWCATVIVVAVISYMVSSSVLIGLSTACAYALIVMSYVVVTGYSGQVSLGQGAFALAGAYAAAMVDAHFLGASMVLSIAIGGITGALVSVVIAIPLMRVSGFYLAVATTAFALAVPELIVNAPVGVTGGFEGLALPSFSLVGWKITDTHSVFVAAALMVIVAIVACRLFLRGRIALKWQAIRDNEVGAMAAGIDVRRQRLMAFGLSGLLAGAGGALFALVSGFITTTDFTFTTSVLLQFAAVAGGLMSLYGAVAGAVFVALIPILVSSHGAAGDLIYGGVAYLVLLLAPSGVGERGVDLCRRALGLLGVADRLSPALVPASGNQPDGHRGRQSPRRDAAVDRNMTAAEEAHSAAGPGRDLS